MAVSYQPLNSPVRSPASLLPKNSFCAGTEPEEYTYSGTPSACQRCRVWAASG